jgi:hypothetical protein
MRSDPYVKTACHCARIALVNDRSALFVRRNRVGRIALAISVGLSGGIEE